MDWPVLVIATGTLFIAILTLLATATDRFDRLVPVRFGFLLDDSIVQHVQLSSGDPEKQVFFRFQNSSKTTVTGLVIDIRFLQPLSLSGTDKALTVLPGKTVYGRTDGGPYYLIRYSELDLAGQEPVDFRVELNTVGQAPGTRHIEVTVYSVQQRYKYKKSDLAIQMT